jgi:CelD/BcsL family acetyltransferase involved in cellulose biosynthesis
LLAPRLQARNWLDLYGLRVGDNVVSILYGMTYRGVLGVYQTGFDPSWARHGVGAILRSYVLQDAIRRGLREADFLKGEYDYKGRWTNAERRTVTMVINNASAMGSFEYVQRNVGEQLKQAARHYLPAPLLRLAKKARASLKHRPKTGVA